MMKFAIKTTFQTSSIFTDYENMKIKVLSDISFLSNKILKTIHFLKFLLPQILSALMLIDT